MALQLIDIGSSPNDGTGDTVRDAFGKCNDNLTELYTERGVQYTSITASSYQVEDNDLIIGHNIYGVNYAGAVAITIPSNILSNKLVIFKDESGLAGTNNITITVV